MITKHDPQGFKTLFNPKNGFSVRGELPDGSDPIYASTPELVDCKITDKCDNGCTYCYMGSGPTGRHCDMEDYYRVLRQMELMGVFQVALGGGEPTLHPRFAEILQVTKYTGIVPNYSTNGNHLTQEIVEASRDLCGAVAVSWHDPPNIGAIERLIKAGVRTNIHYILSEQTVDDAIQLMRELGKILPGLNAIVFLRLKPVGRADGMNSKFNPRSLARFFAETQKERPYKVGFDACMIPMVEHYTNFDPTFFDYCDGGRFSCYVDVSGPKIEMKKCSFDKAPGYNLREKTMAEAWASMTADVKVEECALGLFGDG